MAKLDIGILVVLFVAIVVALGALGVANKAGFVFGKQADLQTTTSPGAKIDGPPASAVPPSVNPDGPATQSK